MNYFSVDIVTVECDTLGLGVATRNLDACICSVLLSGSDEHPQDRRLCTFPTYCSFLGLSYSLLFKSIRPVPP